MIKPTKTGQYQFYQWWIYGYHHFMICLISWGGNIFWETYVTRPTVWDGKKHMGVCSNRWSMVKQPGCDRQLWPEIPMFLMVAHAGWRCNMHLEEHESQYEGLFHILWKIKVMFQTTSQHGVFITEMGWRPTSSNARFGWSSCSCRDFGTPSDSATSDLGDPATK